MKRERPASAKASVAADGIAVPAPELYQNTLESQGENAMVTHARMASTLLRNGRPDHRPAIRGDGLGRVPGLAPASLSEGWDE